MKHYQGARIASIIAVIFFICVLIFVCIFPSVHTKKVVDEIVSIAGECLDDIKQNEMSGLNENVKNISALLENESELMKMFYAHKDIADLENAVHRTESILEIVGDDVEILVSSICDIRECAEHIIERDEMGIGAFM